MTPLRQFDIPQTPAWARVPVYPQVAWVELTCPRCRTVSYTPRRDRRLARVGSQREYAVCRGCGAQLTLGRVRTYPNGRRSWLTWPWRRLRGAQTLLKENDALPH